MIIAVDVYYADIRAKAVGVVFQNWDDSEPCRIITSYTENPLEYEPGSFYKRELPCIQSPLAQVDLGRHDTIIVDGYVYLSNDKRPGLGYYVYKGCEERIPVIGVAKNAFRGNEAVVAKVFRGGSSKPLYITAAGMDVEVAATLIQNMCGPYRFPHLLKRLDTLTKTGWDAPPME